MEEIKIAGYCRISVDIELDKDNTSIENQTSIINDFIKKKFPENEIDFFKDRDRSGYTFEQREEYQKMRKKLMRLEYNILIIKDFSRFSRRNSKGLVELEDLRDAGIRIISIEDGIDYPTQDAWTAIQFRFLINEMPVTDTSKKVRSVVQNLQNCGKWICSVPYGYSITNSKNMTYEIDEPAAIIIREIFDLYIKGWGYKKIANFLTNNNIPTPRMNEKIKKEMDGSTCKLKTKPAWSVITISKILCNDFYIGTLRQRKYARKKINGNDIKNDVNDHIVFENHHPPIIDYKIFMLAQKLLKQRSVTHYRGIKKYDTTYTGYLFCGDCSSPMFSRSRPDLQDSYICGTYHKRGLVGCTSHHIKVSTLDDMIKSHIKSLINNSQEIITKINSYLKKDINSEKNDLTAMEEINRYLKLSTDELKMLTIQKSRDILKNPTKEQIISETYDDLINETSDKIQGLNKQLEMLSDQKNTLIKINREIKTSLEIFNGILNKEKLSKNDIGYLIKRIVVYKDHVTLEFKYEVQKLLSINNENIINFNYGTSNIKNRIVQKSYNHLDKVISVNVVNEGEPSLTTLTHLLSLKYIIENLNTYDND